MSTKPTAAQILQTHLRKSIDARDRSVQISPLPAAVKDARKDSGKVFAIYSFTVNIQS